MNQAFNRVGCKHCIISSGNNTQLCKWCMANARFRQDERVRINIQMGCVKKDNIGVIKDIDPNFWRNNVNMYSVKFDSYESTLFIDPMWLEPVDKIDKSLCECGNPNNPKGQGHSHWCSQYLKEFL